MVKESINMLDQNVYRDPINILDPIEAIRKRPSLYVGQDNNGLNVVKEVINHAIKVVTNGGEAFIRYGEGSYNSQFIVRTFEDIECIDFDEMFEFKPFKIDDYKERYRFAQIGITLALSKELEIIHFTKDDERKYKFPSGISFPVGYAGGVHEPGLLFRVTLDLNLVESVPFKAFIEYLAKNPWFNWSIEMEQDSAGELPIFRGKSP